MAYREASTSGSKRDDTISPEAESQRRQYTREALQNYIGEELPFDAMKAMLGQIETQRLNKFMAGSKDPELLKEFEQLLERSGKPGLIDKARKPISFPDMAKLIQYMPEEYVQQLLEPHFDKESTLSFDIEKAEFFNTPEMTAKRERMQVTTIDYDPESPTYKRDIRDLSTPMTVFVMDHVEADAPFAIGGRSKRDAKDLMWSLWGDIEDDFSTLSNKYQALVVRAEAQRVQCLQLYERLGNNVTRHTKFYDTFHAYLFLTARATTHLHLEQLQQWTILFGAVGAEGWEEIMGLVRKAPKEDVGFIKDRVDMARRCLKHGNIELAKLRQDMTPSARIITFLHAALEYLPGLARLAPYLAMEWYMLPSEDNQGLSQVEIELNLKLAKCAMGIQSLTMLATLHARAVLRHPFVTNKQMAQASLLHAQILVAEKRASSFEVSLLQQDAWLWNAKVLAAVASLRPPNEKWHVQYVEYNLEEKIRRLRGLGAIMPLLFGLMMVQ